MFAIDTGRQKGRVEGFEPPLRSAFALGPPLPQEDFELDAFKGGWFSLLGRLLVVGRIGFLVIVGEGKSAKRDSFDAAPC